jgi:hypothetical protein
MAFKLRSGNKSPFKNMGASPYKDMKTGKYEHSFESPAKHTDKVNEGSNLDPKHAAAHNKRHAEGGTHGEIGSKDNKWTESTKSPAKQRLTKEGEGKDQDKIFNDKGEHVGDRDNQKSPYWYKIDGKKATRAQYIKYKNVPGNMEGGGKQTNDPDVYGRKASNHGRGPKTK